MYAMQSRFGPARARYQTVDLSSRIEGASAHGLVCILFDELLKSLDAMAAACRSRDFSQRGTRQARALAVLHGLEASLDLEKGGDIAVSLGIIYREARRLVIEAGRENDADKVEQARATLNEIASAWNAIA